MSYLKTFCNKTLKNNLVSKFFYKNTKKVPQLKKVVLNFGCYHNEVKLLSSNLLAIELISSQKGSLTTTKHSNVFLKIRKKTVVGCKVSLQKHRSFYFLENTLMETFSRAKNFGGLILLEKANPSTFSFQFKDTFSFIELEKRYYLLMNLSKLDINLVTNAVTTKELLFFFQSLQLPFRKN